MTRVLAVLLVAFLASCAKPGAGDVLSGGESMLKLRSAQTRSFETADRNRVMRGVVATLQDLGFMVTGADAALGTVSGRKFTADSGGQIYELRVTVTVRPRDVKRSPDSRWSNEWSSTTRAPPSTRLRMRAGRGSRPGR